MRDVLAQGLRPVVDPEVREGDLDGVTPGAGDQAPGGTEPALNAEGGAELDVGGDVGAVEREAHGLEADAHGAGGGAGSRGEEGATGFARARQAHAPCTVPEQFRDVRGRKDLPGALRERMEWGTGHAAKTTTWAGGCRAGSTRRWHLAQLNGGIGRLRRRVVQHNFLHDLRQRTGVVEAAPAAQRGRQP